MRVLLGMKEHRATVLDVCRCVSGLSWRPLNHKCGPSLNKSLYLEQSVTELPDRNRSLIVRRGGARGGGRRLGGHAAQIWQPREERMLGAAMENGLSVVLSTV